MIPETTPHFKDWYEKLKYYDPIIVAEYQKKAAHLSHSSLKKFLDSPMAFLMYKVMPKKSTPSMDGGKLMHMLLLEPEKFKDNYFVLDDRAIVNNLLANGYTDSKGKHKEIKSPKLSAPYKEWKANYLSLHEGKTMVELDDLIAAKAALKRMYANGEFVNFLRKLKKRKPEHEIMGEVLGYPVKMVLDNDTDDFIFDLKYVANNSLRSTTSDFFSEKYFTYVQQGLYASAYNFKKRVVVGYLNHMGDMRLREVPEDVLRFGFATFEGWVKDFDRAINEKKTLLLDSDFHSNEYSNTLHLPQWLEVQDDE